MSITHRDRGRRVSVHGSSAERHDAEPRGFSGSSPCVAIQEDEKQPLALLACLDANIDAQRGAAFESHGERAGFYSQSFVGTSRYTSTGNLSHSGRSHSAKY